MLRLILLVSFLMGLLACAHVDGDPSLQREFIKVGGHDLVVGGGHTWPGGAQYLNEHLIGAVSKSFLANPEILRFFERHLGH